MKIDVWFSKKIRFVGDHGDISVEIYDHPTGEDGTKDKERLEIRETYYVANLRQAINRALEYISPDETLTDWETILKVISLQGKILGNFIDAFYEEYGTRCKGIGILYNPKDKKAIVTIGNKSGAVISGSHKEVSEDEPEEEKPEKVEKPKHNAKVKKVTVNIKSVRKA